MAKRGRPSNGSKGVSFTIYAPRYEDYIYLKEKANRLGVSLSALIFSYIASADEKMAERLLEYYREVERKVEELRKDVDIATVVRKADTVEVPPEIEENPEFKNALNRAIHLVKTGQQHMNQVLDWLIPIFENVSLKQGYIPEGRMKVKMYLVSKIVRSIRESRREKDEEKEEEEDGETEEVQGI